MFEGEALVQLIGNFGFPIVLSIYLLHRFERKIEALESAISSLADVFDKNKS
ncbi:YvrJ family protein [Psychrobacillus antarcticus]|uniref:YvrJ family protein n=1 Tax=Psychrobacillus antarcticus TaxID=2879115 RepID=UPI0024085F29|nr:YvrJ family protein [Psychrobacillus antarcticus]